MQVNYHSSGRPPTGADAPTRCTVPGPASGSADGGCTRRCWPSCWPRSPPPAWPPPSRPCPTPKPGSARTWPCRRALERARFEAGRALRQYNNVEPENRLVARTLEAVLEDKLTAVRPENQLAAQQARRPVTLTQEETAWITTAGADLWAIFQAPATTNAQRKELIRAVITEVTVTVEANTDEGDTDGRAKYRSSGRAAPAPGCRCRCPPAATTGAPPAKIPST